MIETIAIILSLFVGYLFYNEKVSNKLLDRISSCLIYITLMLMGYLSSLSLTNTVKALEYMLTVVVTQVIVILSVNIIILWLGSILCGFHKNCKQCKSNLQLNSLLTSMPYLLCVILGIILGIYARVEIIIFYAHFLVSLLLIIILFTIGWQLREQKIPLKDIILNKIGLVIAFLAILSSIISAALSSLMLALNLKITLILSFGFGWYTLSGILVGKILGNNYGSISFFIEFAREIIAIILIPPFSRLNSFIPIGYSGSNAVDFTLPILKKNLESRFIPAAITSGLILNLLVPIIIPLIDTLT